MVIVKFIISKPNNRTLNVKNNTLTVIGCELLCLSWVTCNLSMKNEFILLCRCLQHEMSNMYNILKKKQPPRALNKCKTFLQILTLAPARLHFRRLNTPIKFSPQKKVHFSPKCVCSTNTICFQYWSTRVLWEETFICWSWAWCFRSIMTYFVRNDVLEQC